MVERRKERVLGIWTNLGSRTFRQRAEGTCRRCCRTSPWNRSPAPTRCGSFNSGLADKLFPQQLGNDVGDVSRDDPFRANFIRLKMQHLLYMQKTNGVTLLTPTVFRAEIELPAEAPIGSYDVDIKGSGRWRVVDARQFRV